jgi:hypothetical protein
LNPVGQPGRRSKLRFLRLSCAVGPATYFLLLVRVSLQDGYPVDYLWTPRDSASESPDSTGTRDVYHENKIQFSRTEGTFLESPSGEAVSSRFGFRVNYFF